MGALLAACLCGCRKDEHKSELVGTAGVVKLRFDEESPHPSQTTPLSAKRISTQNNQRSLPEIPQTVPRQDSGDTASELYATVGTDRGARIAEKTTPTAARSSDHPYEHAYARLQDGVPRNEETPSTSEVPANDPATQEESHENQEAGAVVITASVAITGQVSSSQDLPYMTPPLTAASTINPNNLSVGAPQANQQHFSGDSTDSAKGYTSISVREPLSSIRANLQTTNRQTTPHYATVSDDSDEMYAAIDEPVNQVYTSGSETYAQIQPATTKATLHAAPSSSANEENIDEPSGSGLSQVMEVAENNPRASVSEKQQIPKHSRQTSSSSASNSMGNIGSPKPEKRQANSPLPPTPATSNLDHSPNVAHASKKSHDSPVHHVKSGSKQRISSTGDLHSNNEKIRRSLNEKHQRNNSCVSSSDFYGCNYPVDKHRYSSGDLTRPLVARELNFNIDSKSDDNIVDSIYNTIDGNNDIYAAIDQISDTVTKVSVGNQTPNSPLKNLDEMYAKVVKKSKHSNNHVDPKFNRMTASHDEIDSKELNSNSTGVVIRHKKTHNENRLSWTSETKRYSASSSTTITVPSEGNLRKTPSPGRTSRVSAKEDPDYETIERNRTKNHGYETIDKNVAKHRIERSDLGYESVKSSKNHKRRTVPNMSTEHSNYHRNSLGIEPGYETLHSGPDSILSNDPGYEHISRSDRCPSDSDPNYEVLRPQSANIPPYATIQNKNQNVGYSVINKKPKLPDGNWHGNNNEFINSEPNYESMPHETLYNTGSESDPNYESVGPKDPNYESVKYMDVSLRDPPYEKVHQRKSSESSSGSHFNRTGSGASYERVRSSHKYEDKNDNRANGLPLAVNSDNTTVGDYFQV